MNVFQEIARDVDAAAYRHAIDRINYGSKDLSSAPVDQFWLEGDFAISAVEQVHFLRDLYSGRLPFSGWATRSIEDIMLTETQPEHRIRAKTGYVFSTEPAVGWWVGWVERREGPAFFALNLDITEPAHAAARIPIGTAILRELGVLPG